MDKVHECSADINLLLLLARRVQRQRKRHGTLLTLGVVLMSTTLDTFQWEDYFEAGDGNISICRVSVPDETRFPLT